MTSDPYYDITLAAANLKAAVPEQFERLVEAFKILEARKTKDLIAAEPSGIFNAQGQAALAEEVRKRLETCFEKRKQYQTR